MKFRKIYGFPEHLKNLQLKGVRNTGPPSATLAQYWASIGSMAGTGWDMEDNYDYSL